MIEYLKLTCFRRHESFEASFGEGLTAIKGVNEAGKSSLAEAIAYALFGTKALRTPLEEAVTWGHKPAELRVELQFGQHTFVRSKGGAEVLLDGQVFVSGQNEVSSFAADLLGADVATANLLMFANQGGLRGVLDAGPKGTGALLETVAGLDIFDRILDAASEKLSLGSAASIESRLETLRGLHNTLVAPEKPNKGQHEHAVKLLENQFDEAEGQVKVLEPALETLQVEYEREVEKQAQVAKLCEKIESVNRRIAQMDLTHPSGKVQDTSELEARLAAAKEDAVVREAWAVFADLPPVIGHTSRTLFNDMVTALEDTVSEAKKEKAAKVQERAVLEAQLVTSSVCGFCQQDISQFPEVEAKNFDLRTKMALAQTLAQAAEKRIEDATAQLAEYRTTLQLDQKVQRAARDALPYVTIDDTAIPAVVAWCGPALGEPADVGAVKAALAAVKAENQAVIAAQSRYETMVEQKEKAEKEVMDLGLELAAINCLCESDFENLKASLADVREKIGALGLVMSAARTQYKEELQRYESALKAWEDYAERASQIMSDIEQAQGDLATLAFNNALIKKVRAARPIVTNKLWNKVLAAVSSLFSQLRGEKSIVERTAKGFTVNGQAVESLSGSTLDILGLAIRVALVKTFMPGCPFLIADEPGAGCDGGRVASLLGFLTSVGFTQTILVTHDPLSENFANQLIEL